MRFKIVVLRALKLGDMLCSIPALQSLRDNFPEAEISLICHRSQIPLFERYKNLVDNLIPFPGFPGMPEEKFQPEESARFILDIQKQHFDLAIQLQGSGEISNPLISMFGAKTTYGFYREGNYCPNKETFSPYPDHLSEVERCLALISTVTGTNGSLHSSFPLEKKDSLELMNSLGSLVRPFFCVHPGASAESKRWSKKGFALVADYLIQNGYGVIFTGSDAESKLIAEISHLMDEEAIDSASLNLPLGPLAALIEQSEGLICNDTGVSHLSALLKVPSIVIFSETDPKRWAPVNKDLHRPLINPSVEEVIHVLNTSLLNKMELM